MAAPYAFVTLITSDAYLPGALTVAAALKDVHPSPPVQPEVDFVTVCLTTPEIVDVSSIKLLRRAFDLVVGVEIIDQRDTKGLQLLGRPDLNHVLTKLHVFRLTQFSKIIFLDADVLPIRPLSHLFALLYEFSAVPDVGWPDIFNSGMLVLSPGEEKFNELRELLKTKGSWDGGDQGLLNEWRGGNWNRLSFTYNTTPTAAYTYAPAYERFGSQISAIHFIGSEKPWNSIPYRAPGSTSFAPQEAPQGKQAYHFSALVDRWYAIYDKHYRSHPTLPHEFEVKQYTSVWDEHEKDVGISVEGPSTGEGNSGKILGLDELRKIAVQGIGALSGLTAVHERGREGDYISLPLDGRLDLMRPRWEDRSGTPTPRASGSPPRFDTLPTPGPHEVPPAPAHHGGPLQEHHGPSAPPPRPWSPPRMAWNPAVESPPKTLPVPSAFPSDTYFPNVWDASPSKQHDVTYQHGSAAQGPFFQPPPSTVIPEHLIREGHYTNIIGAEYQPDKRKVKSVFPWEEKPRQAPGRVFPTTDSPPPGAVLVPHGEEVRTSPQSSSPSGSPTPQARSGPPIFRGFPSNLAYSNVWDNVPSIQHYASRLVRPSRTTVPPAVIDDDGFRKGYKSWEERTESSMDGDDEGADDEDDSDVESSRERRDRSRTRSRSGSGASGSSRTPVQEGQGREYRGQGVQTIPKESRSKGVQVAIIGDSRLDADQLDQASKQGKSVKGRGRTGSGGFWSLVPPGAMQNLGLTDQGPASPALQSPAVVTGSKHVPSFSWEMQTGAQSPRTFSPPGGSPVRKQSRPSSQKMPSPPKGPSPISSRRASPPLGRTGSSSSETANASPASSTGPLSPPEGAPIGTPPSRRTPARVWDPARGVELFKKSSEEVLQRFLKMSPQSWEEDGSGQQRPQRQRQQQQQQQRL